MSATSDTGADAQNDSVALPANWAETETTEIARYERDDGAVLRIRCETPITSAAKFNRGERVDADGTVRVLFHTEPLPSSGEEVHSGGTVEDARAAALAFIRGRCVDHQRQLVTDAAGVLHCPDCTGGR